MSALAVSFMASASNARSIRVFAEEAAPELLE
jgi:hypothetical protein